MVEGGRRGERGARVVLLVHAVHDAEDPGPVDKKREYSVKYKIRLAHPTGEVNAARGLHNQPSTKSAATAAGTQEE